MLYVWRVGAVVFRVMQCNACPINTSLFSRFKWAFQGASNAIFVA